MLEDALCAGIASAGGVALRAGVLPTPGIAWLVREQGASLGAVISASHNPFPDNGIKLFGADGFKLGDEEEDRVEALMSDEGARPTGAGVGESRRLAGAAERYASLGRRRRRHARSRCPPCACSWIAPTAPPRRWRRSSSRSSGSSTRSRPASPTASTSTTTAARRTSTRSPSACSRAASTSGSPSTATPIACSRSTPAGTVVDGDQIIALLARDLQIAGQLAGDKVVVTSMSNLGFHRAMRELGIETVVTDVGDRYVLAGMLEHAAVLGGEQSGHVIALDRQTTGDGLITAVLLLDALGRHHQPLAEAATIVRKFPQVLINVRADRTRLAGCTAVWEAVERESAPLAATNSGRIVLRSSGTEPLVRVMVEHEDERELHRIANALASEVERELGIA